MITLTKLLCVGGRDFDNNGFPICQPERFAPGTPIELSALNDRLTNNLYSDDNDNSLNWMSQFNLLRAVDDGMFAANSQQSEIFNFRSLNVEIDNYLHFWNDISTNNVGTEHNMTLSEMFNSIHQLSMAVSASSTDAEKEELQNQLDVLILDFETLKIEQNNINNSSAAALNNIYTSYSFEESGDAMHLDYMAFVSNLYSEYMLNNTLDLDQNQEQLLYTIATTCLDEAGPATVLAKALYFVASNGEVIEMGECNEGEIVERSKTEEQIEQMTIYPNPSTGVLNIDLQNESEIEIVSQMGIVLRVYTLKRGTHSLNVDLPSGVYFIRDNKSFNEKLLITK